MTPEMWTILGIVVAVGLGWALGFWMGYDVGKGNGSDS